MHVIIGLFRIDCIFYVLMVKVAISANPNCKTLSIDKQHTTECRII